MVKVLVCDDSALMRKMLRQMIESDPDLEVIATARDGLDAINKARELKPDVVTMDINLPVMDGITALQVIVDENIAPVIMVSSLTQEGALTTFEALELGAFDYIPKPDGTISSNIQSITSELIAKIKAASQTRTLFKIKQLRKSISVTKTKPKVTFKPEKKGIKPTGLGYKAVAIGISTGGPKTIFDVLPYLSSELNCAVFLVQHMPQTFTNQFAQRIDKNTPMRCMEAQPGLKVEPGTIYLAKGGYHLTVFKNSKGEVIIRTPTRPKTLFIPSVNVMMESVLSVFGKDTIGVLMTGMGDDGADAMVKIRKSGGITIAESEESAIVFGMPGEAIKRGGAKIVAPSWEIAENIIKAVSDF